MSTNTKKADLYIFGMVLAVLTFWLFAQSMINIIPSMERDMNVSLGTLNIATSLTSLFSGLFIVVGGGIADRSGRKKMTMIGLILSIVGSTMIILTNSSTILILGRAVQGISAAFIMPATIGLIKTAFDKENRQRALSYWSFGSWGGGGVATLAGGFVATYLGWKWIFVFSIIVALTAMWILRDIEESKAKESKKEPFDYVGFILFSVFLLGANIVVTQGGEFGWSSGRTLILIGVTVLMLIAFFTYEKKRTFQFIDFKLFKSKSYTGAVCSNFFQNGIAATIVVANIYVQVARGFSAFETGLLTIGNIVALLIMIRVGEKMLQKIGPRKPMLWAIFISAIGMSMASMTFLSDIVYVFVVFIGFLIAGVGIGMYATPSIDTAVVHIDENKVGIASGIYKMTSSLGYSFGLAISTATYGAILAFTNNPHIAATGGMLSALVFGTIAIWIVARTIEPQISDLQAEY